MIETLVRMPASEALGWALLHSLWQGAIAALLVALVRQSRARYTAGCMALMGLVGVFVFTFWHCLPDSGTALGASRLVTPVPLSVPSANALPAEASHYRELLAWLTPLWIGGVVFFQLRTLAAWLTARSLLRRGVCQPTQEWRSRLVGLAARMGVSQPVQLLESALAKMPVVVGYLRPAILVPAGLLSAMPPQQIEAILLHELAHIRRHDYLVNLLQTLVEGLLFYHPAVWWISGVIRSEREYCCDDLAAAAIGAGGAYEYALALTALETRRSGKELEYAASVAATGGNLMRRIRRLLYGQQQCRTAAAGWGLTAALVTIAVALAAAWQTSAAPQPTPEQETPYMEWVNEEVVYIIEPGEREAYLQLQSNNEREHFIEQFWLRRDPTPGTPGNEFKREHYRRIGYAMDRFRSAGMAGWKTDRGRVYVLYGPPDEIESHPAGRGGGPPFEQWLYNYIQGIGRRVIVEFVDVNRNGEYRQTRDPNTRN